MKVEFHSFNLINTLISTSYSIEAYSNPDVAIFWIIMTDFTPPIIKTFTNTSRVTVVSYWSSRIKIW